MCVLTCDHSDEMVIDVKEGDVGEFLRQDEQKRVEEVRNPHVEVHCADHSQVFVVAVVFQVRLCGCGQNAGYSNSVGTQISVTYHHDLRYEPHISYDLRR